MSRVRLMAAFLLVVFVAEYASADCLLYRLPKDGTWALYDFTGGYRSQSNSKNNMAYKGTLRISSVGQATEENQKCRWLEVELNMAITVGDNRVKREEIYKILVPEVFLKKGETPMEHVIRAWIKRGASEPVALKNPNDADTGPLPMALSGPWKKVKQLEKTEIDCKLGKVMCEGVEGSIDFPIKGVEKGAMRCKFESRLHPDSPFGSVTAHWTVKPPEYARDQGTMVWNLKLVDFGEDAKSKIPDEPKAGTSTTPATPVAPTKAAEPAKKAN